MEDQIRHTAVTSQNVGMSEGMERITRDTRDGAEWRRLVRCAARAPDHHSWWDRERRRIIILCCLFHVEIYRTVLCHMRTVNLRLIFIQ